MPPSTVRRLYWDSSVFLAYINGEADRVPTIMAILDECERKETEVYTSQVAVTEVAYLKGKIMTPEIFEKIEGLWGIVLRIDVHELVARSARLLLRGSLALGPELKIKPLDALHLATARHLVQTKVISEVNAYETGSGKWKRYESEVGCLIREPWTPSLAFPPSIAANAPAQP